MLSKERKFLLLAAGIAGAPGIVHETVFFKTRRMVEPSETAVKKQAGFSRAAFSTCG